MELYVFVNLLRFNAFLIEFKFKIINLLSDFVNAKETESKRELI